MRWASALSESSDLEIATSEMAQAVLAELGAAPDLVFVFVSPHHASSWSEIPNLLRAAFGDAVVIGGSGAGVVGEGHEVEQRTAIALFAGLLPGVQLFPFELGPPVDLPEEGDRAGWCARLAMPSDVETRGIVLFAEPFGGQAERLIDSIVSAFPEATLVGGVASGAPFPGGSALFTSTGSVPLGAVGVVLCGDVRIEAVVSQGCRAVGPPMLITRCEGARIERLGDERPVEVLRQLYEGLEERDRSLFRQSLFIGVESEPERVEHQEGEFLVRNIRGIDAETGALSLATRVEPWHVVQFVVRDARTAHDDLRQRLAKHVAAGGTQAAGALLLTCLGRGLHLFGRPDHDTDLITEALGDVALGGLFCNGEIGPVGGRAHLHGHTSVVALFSPR